MTKSIQFITKIAIVLTIALLSSSCSFTFGEDGIRGFNFGSGTKGSGNITTETRKIAQEFTKIVVKQGINLVVEQSNDKSVTVQADDNIQELIITTVENGTLIIESKDSYNSTSPGPKVTVKLPTINGLKASSGSKIESINTLISDNLAVDSSSGSTIDLNVEADVITLESSSGSSLKVGGKALKLETSASSGSTIEAKTLLANEVDSQASSGSSTSIAPILSLKAKASSGSSINYYKVPKSMTAKESSGGSISQN